MINESSCIQNKNSAIDQEISLLPSILNTKSGCSFTGVRLNLVGGETFLYKHQVLNIIEAAKKYHFKLSATRMAAY
jgi:radical S-adenosyl methionine domain-containing protein 2